MKIAGGGEELVDSESSTENVPGANTTVEARKFSKNAPLVLQAIAQGMATIPQIAEVAGLNHNQVRYALKNLETHGRVIKQGSQSRRDTRYVLL